MTKENYPCPECNRKQMKLMKLFQRWWCSFCKLEIDVEKTIKEWAERGYSGK